MHFLKFLTPINITEERQKFFASPSYHPRFKYRWETEADYSWPADQLHYLPLVQAILREDNPTITTAASDVFRVSLTPASLSAARQILASPPEPLPHPDLSDVVAKMNAWIRRLDLGYRVEVSPQRGFNMRPRHHRAALVISEKANFQLFSVDGEIRHELTHVIRWVNGKSNGIRKTPDYLPTEEGLATYFQDCCSPEPNASLFQHAAEYAVTAVALHGSLRDVFDQLVAWGFPPSLAWQRAIRHKYGFKDTSKPGDIMKPAMYFAYARKIKRQLTDAEKIRLMVGKIALDDLPSFPRYRGVVPEARLTELFNLRYNS